MQQQQFKGQLSNILKILAFNHWTIESTHWQLLHSPPFSMMGLKNNVLPKVLQNAPLLSPPCISTVCEAVGEKDNDRKF